MKKNNVYIHDFWFVNNYGANLTAFALYNIIKELDYNVFLVDISNFQQKMAYKFSDFTSKYCQTTKHIKSYRDLSEFQQNDGIYISGSDQVFRSYLAKDYLQYFLLDYVNPNSKKIAFSASFGVEKEKYKKETPEKDIEHIKNSLKTFDFVSIREKSGVEICRDLFDINAEWIIDPVFILNKSYYEKIIETVHKDFSNTVVSCIFDKKNNNSDKFLETEYNMKVVELWNSDFTIEEWLKAIKECKFLITNSYHAMCFAIIFNKPFIALSKDKGASARFESIFEQLNIENQGIDNINEIYKKDCLFKINYEKVNQKIEEERKIGLDFLKKSLELPIPKTQEKIDTQIRYLEQRVYELEEQNNLSYQFKKSLWEKWLILYHGYLPTLIKKWISCFWHFIKGVKNARRK